MQKIVPLIPRLLCTHGLSTYSPSSCPRSRPHLPSRPKSCSGGSIVLEALITTCCAAPGAGAGHERKEREWNPAYVHAKDDEDHRHSRRLSPLLPQRLRHARPRNNGTRAQDRGRTPLPQCNKPAAEYGPKGRAERPPAQLLTVGLLVFWNKDTNRQTAPSLNVTSAGERPVVTETLSTLSSPTWP